MSAKICVIGAGSYFFGRACVLKAATSPYLAGGTLALVDTDPDVLATMVQLAKRVTEHTKCGVKVIGSTDRREVMQDSDFTVLTFSRDNTKYRGIDTDIARKHGIRMCSSDTIGPGGIFRALREIPVALAIAKDAEELCPNTWLINFVNPTSVMGIALMRYAPNVRSFALCDGHHEPGNTLHWLQYVGILPPEADTVPAEVYNKLDLAIGGVNHFTWLVRFNYDGKDYMPVLHEKVKESAENEYANPGENSKARYNMVYALELFDLFGAYPTAPSHTKEYVPYFQGYGAAPVKPEPIQYFDAPGRAIDMSAAMDVNREYASGKRTPEEFLKDVRSDHASDIIESMWGNLGKQFYINSANKNAVCNMAYDAFIELRCDIDMHGPRPQPFGEMPRGLLGLQQQVLDTHELTAEAAVTQSKSLLRRAMLTDPICNNITDADGCIADLLEAEREALGRGFRL